MRVLDFSDLYVPGSVGKGKYYTHNPTRGGGVHYDNGRWWITAYKMNNEPVSQTGEYKTQRAPCPTNGRVHNTYNAADGLIKHNCGEIW